MCVEATVREAAATGYRVVLVADACAANRDQDHHATLHVVHRSFGDVRSTDEVLGLLVLGLGARRPGEPLAWAMAVRAVRGATQLDVDEREHMLERVSEMVLDVMASNGLEVDDFISVIFTATSDLVSEFPAYAARQLGFGDVPLICARELEIEGSMPRVVRMMAHVETDLPRADITHCYLHGAAALRSDLTRCVRSGARPVGSAPVVDLGRIVVAVDGTSGSGKSSTCRGVAERLGLRYLDTGAMFRAVTWWMLHEGVDVHDADAVAARSGEPVLASGTDPTGPTIAVDGVDVSAAIRTDEVTRAVSPVSTVPAVRARLLTCSASSSARAASWSRAATSARSCGPRPRSRSTSPPTPPPAPPAARSRRAAPTSAPPSSRCASATGSTPAGPPRR